jgi:hypothetical protein
VTSDQGQAQPRSADGAITYSCLRCTRPVSDNEQTTAAWIQPMLTGAWTQQKRWLTADTVPVACARPWPASLIPVMSCLPALHQPSALSAFL